MTLLFMDGFDVGDYVYKYPTTAICTTTATGTRHSTGRCWYMQSAGGNEVALKKSFPASAQIFLGFAYKRDGMPYDQQTVTLWGDTGTTAHLVLSSMHDGTLKLERGGTTLATSTSLITEGSWHYIEISAVIDSSAGSVIVKIDGITIMSFTGNTKNSGTANTIDAFSFKNDPNGYNRIYYYDDLYLCDALGSVNNTFQGDVRVTALLPTGAGSSTQFTPSTGSNWDNVNDVPSVLTTYNSATTPGYRDTYAMGDLTVVGTVRAVQTCLLAEKSDSSAASSKAALLSGGTVYYDATITLSQTLTEYCAINETDPDTSAAWTQTALNALEFGLEVVS